LPCLTTSRLSTLSAFAHSTTSASAPESKPSASGVASDQPFVGQSDGAKFAGLAAPIGAAQMRRLAQTATQANHRVFKTRAIKMIAPKLGCRFQRNNRLVVKTKRKSPEHPPQFQGVFRPAEGSKRLILSTSLAKAGDQTSFRVTCPSQAIAF
jgi:hypothetical protein